MLKPSLIIPLLAILTQPPTIHVALEVAQSSSAQARADQLYKNGMSSINAEQWQNAINQFSQIKGARSDGAMYWKSYAQNKLRQRAAALETIALLMKQHPRSVWVNDAKALEIEIRGVGGQIAFSAPDIDDDLKLYAINSLMNVDPERALPLLEQVLSASQSMQIKERALFVLSQSVSPRARDLMAQIARAQVHPELQAKALQSLGMSGQKELLSDIYATSGNPESRRGALKGMGIAGAKDQLLTVARLERDAQLRKEAINGLAIAGGLEELRQLYKETTDTQTKRDLIRSALVTGDRDLLRNAAQSESDLDLRREALRTLGASGPDATTFLINIYNSQKDLGMREAAIDGLFVGGAAHELVEMARKETDAQMKKYLASKLALMTNKEATDYLFGLLEK